MLTVEWISEKRCLSSSQFGRLKVPLVLVRDLLTATHHCGHRGAHVRGRDHLIRQGARAPDLLCSNSPLRRTSPGPVRTILISSEGGAPRDLVTSH
jgi:hypothetical protein